MRSETLLHGPVFLPEGGVEFRVWAPDARGLKLRWEGKELALSEQPHGFLAARVPEARPGQSYAFVFPDGRVRPDPASRRQADGVHGPSALYDPAGYRWQVPGFRG